MAEPVKLGVVGLGNIGQQHILHILGDETPSCELAAVCSRQSNDFAKSLDVPHYHDYHDLLRSDTCDALLVATPSFHHYEVGSAALTHGTHVLMEKPIGLSVLEGEKLLAMSSEQQVFALMLNQRTDPLFLKMREVIDAGALGELTRCHWTMTNWFRPEAYFQVSDWRATWKGEGGGLLVNQCIHNLDIFQWLVGMPASLRADCAFGKYHDIEVEDEVSAVLTFSNGASGTFVGSTGEAPGFNRLDIVGNLGYLSFDGERLFWGKNTPGTLEYSRSTRDMFGSPEVTVVDVTPERQVNQHAHIIENFCQAILRGEPLIAPAKEGLNSLALANAMLSSTWLQRDVSFPLDGQLYQDMLDQRIAQSSLREKADIQVNIDMGKSYR